jgi:hypothetical protein
MSQRKTTTQPYTDALEALGDGVLGIAAKLFELGFRGRPCTLDECPVARYLRGTFPEARPIYLGRQVCQVGREQFYLPAAVAEFVRGFDRQGFPDLIEPQE